MTIKVDVSTKLDQVTVPQCLHEGQAPDHVRVQPSGYDHNCAIVSTDSGRPVQMSLDDLIDLVSVLEANRDGTLEEVIEEELDETDERFGEFVVGATVGHNAPDPEYKGGVAKIVSLFATPTGPFARLDRLLAGDIGHCLEDLHVLAPPAPATAPVPRGDNLFAVGATVGHNTLFGPECKLVMAKITGLRFDVGRGGTIALLDRELVGNREHLLRDLHVIAPPVLDAPEGFGEGSLVCLKNEGRASKESQRARVVRLMSGGQVELDRRLGRQARFTIFHRASLRLVTLADLRL